MSKLTMADIKAAATRAGSNYFDKGNSKYFGGDKFWGPYVGPRGTFFVQHNKTGWSIKQFGTDHHIHHVTYNGSNGYQGDLIRKAAQTMAKAAK